MGIIEKMKQFFLKLEGGVTCSMQKHLLTTTFAQDRVEHLIQEPFLAFVDLERKITFH